MARPRFDRLSESYVRQQVDRVMATLDRILGRPLVTIGRVIPGANDLAIHDGRQIEATVLFLDICRFSQRPSWTTWEQQSLLDILALFFTEMIRIVEDHGGTVEKNTGDGLMAYFTRETGGVSAPQKAIAAALTMFDARARLINPILTKSGIAAVDFRICLDHGPLTIAKVGASRGFNGIVAIGATANVASKMLQVAEPNTLLVGSMALAGIPPPWRQNFVRLATSDTGWIFRASGEAYSFWEYTGRWTDPV